MGRHTYPPAPDMRLPATQRMTDGELFYIIQNGIRLTAMPAWGGGSEHDGSPRYGSPPSCSRSRRKAHIADLKPGARVVVDVPEGSKDKLAQSVKIGELPKAAVRRAHASQN